MPTPVFFVTWLTKYWLRVRGSPLKKCDPYPTQPTRCCNAVEGFLRHAWHRCFVFPMKSAEELQNLQIYMYVYIYIIHIHIYIQIHIHISIYLSIDLSIYLSISLSTYAYMYKYLCRDPRPRLMGLRQGQWPRGNACRGEAVHQAVVQLQAEEPPTSGWFTHWLMGYLSWLIDCEGMVNSAGQ